MFTTILKNFQLTGVPKHSDFEPDYFLAKGNGKPAELPSEVSGLANSCVRMIPNRSSHT